MSRILRAETVPRWATEGPFAHLDIRTIVDAKTTGAELVMFGQTTYPQGATHERHFHPRAEEVVMVLSGRAEQEVGGEILAMGPGDVCFIPRGVPHRITGASPEDLVILWILGGASSIEAAGYEPVAES